MNMIRSVVRSILREVFDRSTIKEIPDGDVLVRQISHRPHQGQYEVRLKPKELDILLKRKQEEELDDNYPLIDVEYDNVNTIHVSGIPEYFKGLGIGRKMLLAIIRKVGYVSLRGDSSDSLKRAWDSMVRQPGISYVNMENGRCFAMLTPKAKQVVPIIKKWAEGYKMVAAESNLPDELMAELS